MRVLLVCHGYPPTGVAGVERLSAQTAAELTARGHEVTVLTRRLNVAPTLSLERDVRAGVPVVSIAGQAAFDRFPAQEPALERIFERMLAEFAPDVVLASHLLHHSPGYVAVAHRWGIPVVMELHDFFALCPRAHLQRRSGELCDGPRGGRACAAYCYWDQQEPELRWSLRAESFTEAVRRADAVLAPSRFVADAFEPIRGQESSIEVIGNGVAEVGPVLREPDRPAAPLHLASIGITVEHKGFQVVVEALRRAELPAAQFTILGVTLQPQARELHEAADEVRGLELRLFGAFAPAHLPALLADADVAVVPSLVAETYSIVAREAFACGLPVIASRIGALPEAIRPGDNGWLFTPGDASELAVLLRRLHHEPHLIRRAAAGIQPADVPGSITRIDSVEALLEAVAADPDRRRPYRHGAERILMREALAAARES